MVKRNNNNLSGLSSVARSMGEFLYQCHCSGTRSWIYTYELCALFEHLLWVRRVILSKDKWRCGDKQTQNKHTIIWPLQYWFRSPHLRCCCHCVVKAWENEVKVLTKTLSDIWDIAWFSSYRSSGVVKGNEYPMVLIWLSMRNNSQTASRLSHSARSIEFRQNLCDISV